MSKHQQKHIVTKSWHKDIRQIVRLAQKNGWDVSLTRGNTHPRLESPSGEVVFTSGTASDWRTIRNFRAELRRKGLDI